ncbi:hypothetical protein GRI89_06245 [Altererythrobacter salegens]|uniref:Uncharacterized protein n=1 Tax=Croceibacterium salegens TaxID=1737568 RepID=A0A6I4SUM5_9SPHN|nr:hypothetical protein [Croceibacterium salegens]MXO59139.1 hypothetical protein [Croceibacterium salegens]
MDSDTVVVVFMGLLMSTMATMSAVLLVLMFATTTARRTRTPYAALGGAAVVAAFFLVIMIFAESGEDIGTILGIAVMIVVVAMIPCWPVAYLAFRRIEKLAIFDASMFE